MSDPGSIELITALLTSMKKKPVELLRLPVMPAVVGDVVNLGESGGFAGGCAVAHLPCQEC
jgi:hypothetical protein